MSLRSEEMRRQGVRQRQPGSGRPRGVGMTADGCLRRRCTPGWPPAAQSAGDRTDDLSELDCAAVQLGGHRSASSKRA